MEITNNEILRRKRRSEEEEGNGINTKDGEIERMKDRKAMCEERAGQAG